MPAVTLPSFLKAGFSLARASRVVVARGCSSVAKASGSPCFCGIRIGVISSLKRPDSMAATAFCWDPAAKRSCCSRLMP
ncbi:hypothetical protein D3C78_1795960 [compost metagenome]